MYPEGIQLKLSDKDRKELQALIESDWDQDSTDLETRATALKGWVRLWRAASEVNPVPEEEGSNFSIPLVLWQILNASAKELSALFGEDTDIIIKPRGKADVKNSVKVKRYMEWRVKSSLKLFKKYADFVLLKRIFGSVIAYLAWKKKTRTVKELETKMVPTQVIDPETQLPVIVPKPETKEVEREVIEFEGLDFTVENIEDWAVPKSAKSLETTDHFIRRLTLRVDEILDLRDSGKIDKDIVDEDFIEDLYRTSETDKTDDSHPDVGKKARQEKERLSGLNSMPIGRESLVVVLNWVGKFRLSKGDKKSERPEELVCFYIPSKNKMVGAARLVDIFPDGRIPFVKSDNIRDPNMFWGIGYAELLESISAEMNCIHNITTDAGLIGVGPMGFYKPLSGTKSVKFKYEPWMMVPTNDPKNDVYFPPLPPTNMSPYIALMPQLLAMAERLTGVTETQMGRQFSGPNAPRTYGQQALLQAESNTRLFLDLQLERETFSEILTRIWEADKRWLPKPVFFRVVEEDIEMTQDDFQGDYDFDIGPPTSQMNRQQAKQDLLQLYALALQNPLSAQNPAINLSLSRAVLEKFGYPQIAMLLPDPEQMAPPQSAEYENAVLLQGGDVDPHPADNHVEHVAKHTNMRDRLKAQETLSPGFLSMMGMAQAVMNIDAHIAEHQQAMKTQGASINMIGRGAPTSPQMNVGSANPAMPQMPRQDFGLGQSNPAGNDAQAGLSSLLNSGGLNLG